MTENEHRYGESGAADFLVDGASFILDMPKDTVNLWGAGEESLWSQGEALMIAGPQGVAKTTLAGNLVKSMLCGGDLLGYAVARADQVLYLAMDRPRQIGGALGRMFGEEQREQLENGLTVLQGPPPADFADHPATLMELADRTSAGVVIVDSLKDAALGLSSDETGAGYNRARQMLLQSGVELIELHHVKKTRADGRDGALGIDDIYGSTWITSGAGSVFLLQGDPGDNVVSMSHVKQPRDVVGPLKLLHDRAAGSVTVLDEADLASLVDASGPSGLTAKAAATALNEQGRVSPAEAQKARRALQKLESEGVLMQRAGSRGGVAATWVHRNHALITLAA
ncbi:AAA family ATPase [Rhodococcoides kyotonense]|uniref:Replicative DNA helicase n=1 Tax=Rhodococcoides kyotonense TaxID=398843 RepID=A0A239FDT8_9NOCA|nr:AAA family ATPase [Rhodococcus kyotonensis]SNS54997.1 replicative DNA helicase [Rhodococcus kyotonensis]